MSKPQKNPQKPAPMKRYNIMLDRATRETFKRAGNGNMSLGAREVARAWEGKK
jgi:hypothetical protein